MQDVLLCPATLGLFLCGHTLQALTQYGESVRLGHKNILQSLPRLLTLYFEFGSKVAATKAINQKIRTAQTQVGCSSVLDAPLLRSLLCSPATGPTLKDTHPKG